MSSTSQAIRAVPTNIITGFLGVGKTSCILNLLKNKPANERWAVLVNEFGEIGVDGSLFEGQHTEESGVFIREVPGGCMCCTSGLPMQIALNQLLMRARPDRLLIEPTGLGHPLEVLQTLSDQHYKDILSIQKVVTLVDARKLSDPRYKAHATFNQQIAIADLVVGNKQDLYQNEDKNHLIDYLKEAAPAHTEVTFTEQGSIDPALLNGPTQAQAKATHHHAHEPEPQLDMNSQPIPESGFIKVENQGEGFKSVGWRFAATHQFDRDKLFRFFTGLHVERMKAVFITQEGIVGYNLTPDALTEVEIDDTNESRVEIIARELDDNWQQALLDCLDS